MFLNRSSKFGSVSATKDAIILDAKKIVHDCYKSLCRRLHIIKQYPYDCTQTAAQADKTNRTGSSYGAV